MLTQELQECQAGSVVVSGKKAVDPVVFSPQMVRDLRLMALAGQVMKVANRDRGRATRSAPLPHHRTCGSASGGSSG